MVSAFISELHGIVRCTVAERDAHITSNPQSSMAKKLAAQPDWDNSSTLVLKPGAAAGKDKYFDAEQLIEQTDLTMEIFDATHAAPGRWVYHPSSSHLASASLRGYPCSFEAVWLPSVSCIGLFFFDHSTGHGAFAADALVANRCNKGPDWKGSVPPMHVGSHVGSDGSRKVQVMQFEPGEKLLHDIVCPKGVDPDGEPVAAPDTEAAGPDTEAAAPDTEEAAPPSDAELVAAFKLFASGARATLKKHNPMKCAADVKAMEQHKWDQKSQDDKLVYVKRVRAKSGTGQGQAASDRTIKAGSDVPRILIGRHKGSQYLLAERELYPTGGLKGACQNEKAHSASNGCCCCRLLSVQPDFAQECSQLQHHVEVLVKQANTHPREEYGRSREEQARTPN